MRWFILCGLMCSGSWAMAQEIVGVQYTGQTVAPKYQIIQAGNSAVLLDAYSGKTWILTSENNEWVWKTIRKSDGAKPFRNNSLGTQDKGKSDEQIRESAQKQIAELEGLTKKIVSGKELRKLSRRVKDGRAKVNQKGSEWSAEDDVEAEPSEPN